MPFIVVATITEPAPFAAPNAPTYLTERKTWTENLRSAKEFDNLAEAIQFIDSGVTVGILDDLHILPLRPWIEQLEQAGQ